MRMRNKFKILVPVLMMFLVLSACRYGEERYELTSYIGSEISSFEKGTGVDLVIDSNGVYIKEGVVQVIAPGEKINSLTLLNNETDYMICGVKIGMKLTEAEPLLQEIFGKEISKTINSDNNSITYFYLGQNKKLYISYDVNTELVKEISYYNIVTDEDSKEDQNLSTGELMMMVGDTKVYYNEAMVYLKSAEQKYEKEYGQDIWNVDIYGNGKTFDSVLKDEVIKQITELKIIKDQAKELGMILSEEEQADAKAYAKEHYQGLTTKDIDQYFITESLLEEIYADNLLANKVFEAITINVDTNVPDAIAKQITVQHILINNRTSFTAEEQSQAYQKVENLLAQAKETDDFYALAEANSEAEVIEYTFGRGEGPKEYSDAFEQAAFTLKTGEVSPIISTDYGWHILYCVSDFNEDATIQVKENIIEQRRNKMFADLYSEWSTKYDIVVNSEAWNTISLKE
jgi:foldase protein PrsA